jgi:hypothetical protein
MLLDHWLEFDPTDVNHRITLSIAAVSAAPERSQEIRPGRCVYQSTITPDDPFRVYLPGVFVDIDHTAAVSPRPCRASMVGVRRVGRDIERGN